MDSGNCFTSPKIFHLTKVINIVSFQNWEVLVNKLFMTKAHENLFSWKYFYANTVYVYNSCAWFWSVKTFSITMHYKQSKTIYKNLFCYWKILFDETFMIPMWYEWCCTLYWFLSVPKIVDSYQQKNSYQQKKNMTWNLTYCI